MPLLTLQPVLAHLSILSLILFKRLDHVIDDYSRVFRGGTVNIKRSLIETHASLLFLVFVEVVVDLSIGALSLVVPLSVVHILLLSLTPRIAPVAVVATGRVVVTL